MKNNNPLAEKSKSLALIIIKLYQFLTTEKREFMMSKQLFRSATSVGANIKEGLCGTSREDFFYKLNLALKEASETEYWLELLFESNYINEAQFRQPYDLCKECIKILTATINKKDLNK